MAFAILVTGAKFKCKKSNMGSLKIKEAHIERDENYKNIATHADPNLKNQNEILIGNGNIYEAVKNEIDPIKFRPNQVGNNEPIVSYDLILTASPEFFYKTDNDGMSTFIKRDDYEERLKDWKEKAKSYLEKNHYCVAATLHLDETTPHIHATSIPFVRKADKTFDKTMTRGKAVMDFKKFQDDYFQEVGLPLGLQRGIENSKAENQELKTFYKSVNKKIDELKKDVQAPLAKIERRIERIKTNSIVEEKGWFGKSEGIVARDNDDVKADALTVSKATVLEIAQGYSAKNFKLEDSLKKSQALTKTQSVHIKHLMTQNITLTKQYEKAYDYYLKQSNEIEAQKESIKIFEEFIDKEIRRLGDDDPTKAQIYYMEFEAFRREQKKLIEEKKKPILVEKQELKEQEQEQKHGQKPEQKPVEEPKSKAVLQVKPKGPVRGMRQ